MPGILDRAIGKSTAGQAGGLRLRRGEETALSTLSAILSASALALHQSVKSTAAAAQIYRTGMLIRFRAWNGTIAANFF